MIIRLLALLLVTTSISPRCLEGCLRCTKDYNCLYCDVLEGYYLEDNRCEMSALQNCALRNQRNQCLKCDNTHYLDQFTNSCIEMIEQVKVKDCAYHQKPNYCQVCTKGFYALRGTCTQVSSPIQNCEVENSRGECERCEKSYVRSIDRKKCGTKPTAENCRSFANVQCRSCKAGYMYNENYYMDTIFGFSNRYEFDRLNELRQDQLDGYVDTGKFNTCQQTKVSNCQVYESFTECKKCNAGFVLNEKFECVAKPNPIIPNCQKYSTLTSCVECEQGFFPQSSDMCVKVTPIENCLLYKQNVNNTFCARCLDSYYLSAENLCTKRGSLSEIDLCEELAFNFEKCTRCRPGYLVTSDGFRCLAKINNCETYEKSSKVDTLFNCNTCEQGYFYQVADRVCLEGNVQLCVTYKRTSPECKTCQKKFYLKNNACHSQVSIQDCSSYSGNMKNECNQCNQHNFLFTQDNFCYKVDLLPNCSEYNPNGSCKECDDGYMKLANQPTCFLIPPQENCLKKNTATMKCTKCKNGYALNNDQCFIPSEQIVHGCAKHNADGKTKFAKLKCDYCKLNFVPVNYHKTYVCKKRPELQRMAWATHSEWVDDKCLQYRNQDPSGTAVYKCEKCKPGFVIVNGKCAENCYEHGKRTLYKEQIELRNLDGDELNESIYFRKYNQCNTDLEQGRCKVAALNVFQSFKNPAGDYSCERCNSNYLPVMNIKKYGGVSLNDDVQRFDDYVSLPTTAGPGVGCVDLKELDNAGILVGNVSTENVGTIDNCTYYSELTNRVFGCRRCDHGYGGKIVQMIKNCETFATKHTCAVCTPGYYLKSSSECRPVDNVDNCVTYANSGVNENKCTKCLDTHYLTNSGQLCTQRLLTKDSDCVLSDTADICVKCNTGYLLNSAKVQCFKFPEFCDENASGHTITDNNVICDACDITKAYKHWTTKICILGSVNNCAKYQQPTTSNTENDKCTECLNTFYLDNNVCITHGQTETIDPTCGTWHKTLSGQCKVCKPGAFLFKKTGACSVVDNTIKNCIKYQDSKSCAQCANTYYLNNVGTKCLKIPPDLHCQKMVVVDIQSTTAIKYEDYDTDSRFAQSCLLCENKFFLRQKIVTVYYKQPPNSGPAFVNKSLGVCVTELEYMRENCKTSSSTATASVNLEQGGCTTCMDNHFPFDITDMYICEKRDYLKVFRNDHIDDPKCAKYRFDSTNDAFVCEECANGYFMKIDGITCSDTCDLSANRKYLAWIDVTSTSDRKVLKNVCKPTMSAGLGLMDNCDIYVYKFLPTGLDSTAAHRKPIFGCFKCLADFSPVLKVNTIAVAGDNDILRAVTPYDTMNNYDESKWHDLKFGNFYVTPQACVNFSLVANTVFGVVNDKKEIENCAMYAPMKIANDYGCMRCHDGYTSRAMKDQGTGGVYNYLDKCERDPQCVTGYSNVRQPYTAAKNLPVTTFMSCHACADLALAKTAIAKGEEPVPHKDYFLQVNLQLFSGADAVIALAEDKSIDEHKIAGPGRYIANTASTTTASTRTWESMTDDFIALKNKNYNIKQIYCRPHSEAGSLHGATAEFRDLDASIKKVSTTTGVIFTFTNARIITSGDTIRPYHLAFCQPGYFTRNTADNVPFKNDCINMSLAVHTEIISPSQDITADPFFKTIVKNDGSEEIVYNKMFNGSEFGTFLGDVQGMFTALPPMQTSATTKFIYTLDNEKDAGSTDKSPQGCRVGGKVNGVFNCSLCKDGFEIVKVVKDTTTTQFLCRRFVTDTCKQMNIRNHFNDNFRLLGKNRLEISRWTTRFVNKGCNVCNDSTYVKLKVTAAMTQMDKYFCSKFVAFQVTSTARKIEKPKSVDAELKLEFMKDQFIDDCAVTNISYGREGEELKCRECKAVDGTKSWRESNDGSCVLKDTGAEPIIYVQTFCKQTEGKDSFDCVECDPGYTNIGGICRKATITADLPYFVDNCHVIDIEKTQKYHQVICSVCKDEYYLKQVVGEIQECVKIPIDNCKTYDSTKVQLQSNSTEEENPTLTNAKCRACVTGYALKIIARGPNEVASAADPSTVDNDFQEYCVPMKENDNYVHDSRCTALGIVSQDELNCTECKDNSSTGSHYFLNNVSSSNLTKCYHIRENVPNCLEYDQEILVKANIHKKHWKCTACENNATHFLNRHTNRCVPTRTNSVNCKMVVVGGKTVPLVDPYADRCLECATGYELVQNGVNSVCQQIKTFGLDAYVNSCSSLDECDQDAFYEGLGVDLTSVFSCHKCTDSDMIPYAGVKYAADLQEIIGLKQYSSKFEAYKGDETVLEELSVKCLLQKGLSSATDATAREALFIAQFFGSVAGDVKLTENCGLVLVNIDDTLTKHKYTGSATTTFNLATLKTDATIRCAACKPGYKPTQIPTLNGVPIKNFVQDCVLISTTTCETGSLWFNACSQCKQDHTYAYKNGKGTDYSICHPVDAKHKSCYAYDIDNSRCQHCKTGTFMNADNVCEIIHPPNCVFRKFSFGGNFMQHDIFHGLGYASSELGCTECQEGYVAVYQDKPLNICTYSMYHETLTTSATKYITNCLNYTYNHRNQLLCEKCKAGFSSSPQGSCIENGTDIKDCKEAIISKIGGAAVKLCNKCNDGFVLVNRKCLKGTVKDCVEYWNDRKLDKNVEHMSQNNAQICTKCKATFYLEKNLCHQGVVANCEVNDTKTRCIECNDGFTKVEMKGGVDYCYKNHSDQYCASYDADKFQSNTLKCTECSDKSKYVISDRISQTLPKICQSFIFTPHCLEYDNTQTISKSGFSCQKCERGFFLDTSKNQCVQRTLKIDKCQTFEVTLDKCKVCKPGHFMNTDNTNCPSYPQGIHGCDVYRNKVSCQKCQTKFYLKNELCQPIKTEIVECLDYDDEGVCLVCNAGFILYQDKCQSATATGCLTYQNQNTCSSCPSQKQFLQEGVNLNCVDIVVTNCMETEIVEPYNCVKCVKDMVLNADNQCEQVTLLITNCEEYKDQTTCLRCSGLTALAVDGSACLDTPEVVYHLDLNCQDSMIPKDPVCNTCMDGFQFIHGACTACDGKQVASGCLNCDPQWPNVCLMCKTGYVHTPEGDCVMPQAQQSRRLFDVELDDFITRRRR